MSDLISIASSGVMAYQRALGSVSNNIANMATEGYSKQEVNLNASMPRAVGPNYLGTGVIAGGVRRAYDEFVESNLRRSQSLYEGQGPLVEYTNRVMDLMADEKLGLSSALTAFFGSARSLALEPASSIARSAFLRGAEGVASSFRQMAGQLDTLDTESQEGVQAAVQKLNTLAQQIATLNGQLAKNSRLDRQPPELLDRRDALLRDLSEVVQVRTAFASNGQVSISLGDNFRQGVLVDGQQAVPVGAEAQASGQIDLLLAPLGKREVLASLSGGTLGGLLAFRSQVLQPSRDKIDFLATALAQEVNALHREGIDGLGRPGEDVFTIDPAQPRAAMGIALRLDDNQRVATAAPFRAVAHAANLGSAVATVQYQAPTAVVPPAYSTLLPSQPTHPNAFYREAVSFAYQSVATLPAGARDVSLELSLSPGQWPQLLTRDGRHLLGSPLDDATREALMTADGITPGATYSADYLNQTEPGYTYRGASYFLGAAAQPLAVDNYSLETHAITGQTMSPARLLGEPLSPGQALQLGDGALRLNGIYLGPLNLAAADSSPQDVADWLNGYAGRTGVTASVIQETLDDGAGGSVTLQRLALTANDSQSEVRLEFGPGGGPADLAQLGLRTGVHFRGEVPEDLVLMVSGEGPYALGGTLQQPPFNAQQALREQPVEVRFVAPDRYQITDLATGSVLAERAYDLHQPEPVIDYRGLAMTLSRAPQVGDRFRLDGNQDGVGDNSVALAMAELEYRRFLPGNTTLSDAYLDQSSRVANVSRQAGIAREALSVVKAQAVQARDAVAGVSLDDEAADLVRFQQAYQASARVMQTATQLFDTLLQAT